MTLKSNTLPTIDTINVINLDKDIKRWNKINDSSIKFLPKVKRFKAVYGKELKLDNLQSLGIGSVIYLRGSGSYTDQKRDYRNLGAIGCFLSHRDLLESLAKRNYSGQAGHLILEDDVSIPDDLFSKWNTVKKEIPGDWDMIYLGISNPIGKQISKNVMRLKNSPGNTGNWGTHAYMVRHSSIKKILKWLKYMVDAIDMQFSMKFDDWNVYCTNPFLINLDPELSTDSTIQKM